MGTKRKISALIIFVCLSLTKTSSFKLKIPSKLRIVSRKVSTVNLDSVEVSQVGPKFAEFAIGGGLIAYRSSVIASLSQVDRGENEAAMESLRVAIASLALETTKTYGLPVVSVVMDKIIKNYGAKFPKTINGFKSYNEMLGSSILNQVEDVASPQMLDKSEEVLDSLETLKKQMRIDFGSEVTSYLKSTTAHDDLVKSLKHVKTWAKVAKWGDFLAGPIFDVAMIGFTGWQLHGAIQSGDDLAIASGSLSIAASVVGVTSFVVSCLATTGTVLAATAGPVGAIIGCVLSLAALIIDVINSYNPEQTINKHLEIVKSLTQASKDRLKDVHADVLRKASANEVEAGFNTLYEVNQAMLARASIDNHWDTIKGFNSDRQFVIKFNPDDAREEGDLLVVGDRRVFDKKHYQNWAFKPEGREEIGYNYYGKVVNENVGGITVRLDTEMVTNREQLWFWLNGAKVTTYSERLADAVADDNVHIGDFRTLLSSSRIDLYVKTGGGNDMVQITGVICSEEQQKQLHDRCLRVSMGDGYDTISFYGMDTRPEKLKWLMKHDDLEWTKDVVGISFNMVNRTLSYRLKDNRGRISEKLFSAVSSVERFIGSPLDDVVKINDDENYAIKEFAGRNVYELQIGSNRNGGQHVIEDNSDTPGKLIIRGNGIYWNKVFFCKDTNIILIFFGANSTTQIFLKRCKPGLDDFLVQLSSGRTRRISAIESIETHTDIVLPFVPFPYKFDKNLVTAFDQETYIELWAPNNTYPQIAVRYKIKLTYASSIFILTKSLLDVLRDDTYTLKAKRKGRPQSSNSWTLELKRRRGSGGWKVDIGQAGIFVYGVPGTFQDFCKLANRDDSEIDIFIEYQSFAQASTYEFIGDFVGTENPDKLIFKFPFHVEKRDPTDRYVIDLKGPQNPSGSARNELVASKAFFNFYFNLRARRKIDMELERESKDHDWHLKLWSKESNGGYILRIDVTLRGVHAIVTDQWYDGAMILNLHECKGLSYDLDEYLFWNVGDRFDIPRF